MQSLFKNTISILHLLLMYIIGMLGILSTNENVVFGFLIVMMLVKFSYYLFERCIVTYLEDGKMYPSASQIFGYTITKKDMKQGLYEEIIINFALILLVNKLLLMLILKYYHKSFTPTFKEFLYTYVYNNNEL